MNIDLAGQIHAEIEHSAAITLTRLSLNETIPTQLKKGGYGIIGPAQGIGEGSGSMTFVVPKTGLEFDIMSLKKKPGGFTISFDLGVNRFAIRVFATKWGATNDPGAGNLEVPVDFVYGDTLQIS